MSAPIAIIFFTAGAAVAWRFTALHYAHRLAQTTASAASFKGWWIAASDRALRAEARLSIIHEQHVAAGKAAHAADRALRDATTERLRHCAPTPLKPREQVEAEVAALRAARKSPPSGVERGEISTLDPAREGFCSPAPLSSRGPAARAPVSLPMKGARHG